MSTESTRSEYYQHSRKVPFASRISWLARRRIFDVFMEVMQPQPQTSVLDVGVTIDTGASEANFFEQLYPYRDRLVCAGIEDASHLERDHPGVRFQQISADDPLPFADQSFDVVFSNAVIEHVGNTERQRRFVADLARVARRLFLTTPNRWFPIETHTGLPFVHYLPTALHRPLLRHIGYEYWASEANLNLLTLGELPRLLPAEARMVTRRAGVGWGPWRSNLIAYT